jgi:hypothetical protein
MAQYTWTLAHGDTLPAIAEACGHSGEWTVIMESSPFLEGLDYTMLSPGTAILLPDGWLPAGVEPEPEPEPPSGLSSTDLSGLSAADLIDLANAATTDAELDAIDAAAAGRVTVTNAVEARRGQLELLAAP